MKSTEKEKQAMREWYKKNRLQHIKNVQARQKETSYSSEKTNFQRQIRYLKRETRRKYPLKNKKCEFCQAKATERHHNTSPIHIDKFNYCCHKCHNQIHNNYKEVKTNE